ncbi:MAG: hypothetical protein Q9187_004847 [Circinaria calcarea]
MPGNQVATLPSSVPQFWAGQNLTLALLARVDGTTYSLMGVPSPPTEIQPASVTSAEYTSTHTVFKLTAGTASLTLDFFSPVSPNNFLRQSLPFSYLTIRASNTASSAIEVYADIDESWTGQTGNTWSSFSTSEATSVFQLSVNGAYLYSENADQALWGNVIFASRPSTSSNLSTQSGSFEDVRGQFATKGSLDGSVPAYTAGDVIAIAQDLGTVTAETSVTFAFGYVREAAVNYLGNARTGFYRATYKDPVTAVSYFLDDLSAAQTESLSVDSDLMSRSTASAGSNYSDIITLSVRQLYGAIDVTISNDTLNTDDVLVFLKEISSNGNTNTVDVLFPAFPAFYVMAPEYIRLSLEPVLQYLATGRWKQPYPIHDIGTHYPNATGHDDQQAEPMPVEESGNLLIMAYAYMLATGKSDFATRYHSLFQSYADYLVANGLNISFQLSTDDFAGPLANQTNLAIKAAVGLTAFGAMTGMDNYTTVGLNFADQLYGQGLGTDAEKTHFTLTYGNDNSFTTAFNLYPSTLLNLSTFPTEAFEMETIYYPTIRAEAGIPLDSRVDLGKTDWMHFAAAYTTNTMTRDLFINDVHAFISQASNDNQVPFSDKYFVSGDQGNPVGGYSGFRARPVVGGHFATLALDGAGPA